MGGSKHTSIKLNDSLELISNLLNNNNITNWFIAYGTLLGIVRENSCIDNDDDVDIITDINNHDIIKQLFIDNNMVVCNDRTNFFRVLKNKYAPIDFYFAEVDKDGNFNDTWENVLWSNCYNSDNNLIEYLWNNTKLYLPFNYEDKLINRYGEDWKIPMDTKGPTPKKKIL